MRRKAISKAFSDALARHRAAKGLPAVSLDLDNVRSVGYVAEIKYYRFVKRKKFSN